MNNKTHRRAESSTRNVPSRAEHKEIGERNLGLFGLGGQDAEDRGIDVVLGDATNMGEFLHGVLVGHIATRDD